MIVIGISGALTGLKTLQMVHDVLASAKEENPAIKSELIDLKEYDIEFMRGFPLSFYNDDTQTVVKKILAADCLIIGTPIYQASISGCLKNLLDLLPTGALKSKVAGYISTAGSEKHFLVAEYQLVPILRFLGAEMASTHVFVHDDCFDDESIIIDSDVKKRIQKLAQQIVNVKETN